MQGCRDEPQFSRTQRLLDGLDSARLELAGETSGGAHGELVEVDGALLVTTDLPRDLDWEQLPPDPASVGAPLGNQVAWRAELPVPTSNPTGLVMESPERPLARWRQGARPAPWSYFYSPGGFVGQGLYLALPPGLKPDGLELSLRFEPTTPLLIEHLSHHRSAFPAALLETRATVNRTSRPAIFLTPGITLALPLRAEPDARLRFALGRSVQHWHCQEGRAELAVGVRQDGSVDWRWRRAVETGAADGWLELDVPLGSVAGGDAELVLALESTSECPVPFHYLGDPVIVHPRPGPQRPDVVLVVIDGLRSDRVGSEPSMTPELDRLAARGLWFTQAYPSAPWTRPSIASLFTGMSSVRHGIQTEGHGQRLSPRLPHLAEALRDAGYATAGVSANLHLSAPFGLQRGFSEFRTALEDGAVVVDEALEWMDRAPHRPFFLFVFLMDTHYPWRHRPEYDLSSAIDAEPPDVGAVGSAARRRRRGLAEPGPEAVRKLEALYDENVRYADEQLGRLLAGVERAASTAGTVVAVTADHGEAFGEHGDFFHGWNLYGELTRVPLVLAGPGVPVGEAVLQPVAQTDLAAALLALAGVDAALPPPSQELLSLARRPARYPVFAQSRFRGVDLLSVVMHPHKLIWNRRADRLELYDLDNDPLETEDLSTREPERARELKELLEEWLERERAAAVRAPAAPLAPIDEETLEGLRSLGYVQ